VLDKCLVSGLISSQMKPLRGIPLRSLFANNLRQVRLTSYSYTPIGLGRGLDHLE
jgi:hypothetical protein